MPHSTLIADILPGSRVTLCWPTGRWQHAIYAFRDTRVAVFRSIENIQQYKNRAFELEIDPETGTMAASVELDHAEAPASERRKVGVA